MTKPTEEQIKALKPGDRVLVEATIWGPVYNDGDLRAEFVNTDGESHVPVRPDTIHSILPRQIKVGDRVRDRHGNTFKVAAEPRKAKGMDSEDVALWDDVVGYTVKSARWLTGIE